MLPRAHTLAAQPVGSSLCEPSSHTSPSLGITRNGGSLQQQGAIAPDPAETGDCLSTSSSLSSIVADSDTSTGEKGAESSGEATTIRDKGTDIGGSSEEVGSTAVQGPRPSRQPSSTVTAPVPKKAHGQRTITSLFAAAAVPTAPPAGERGNLLTGGESLVGENSLPPPSVNPKLSSVDDFLLESDDSLLVDVPLVKKELSGTSGLEMVRAERFTYTVSLWLTLSTLTSRSIRVKAQIGGGVFAQNWYPGAICTNSSCIDSCGGLPAKICQAHTVCKASDEEGGKTRCA